MKTTTGDVGKAGELEIISRFIREGFEVFLPIVDKGIDFVAKKGDNYFSFQVKTRNDTPIFHVKIFKPRKDFYIICYYMTNTKQEFWIIPSEKFKNIAKVVSHKNHKYLRIEIKGRMREKLQMYKENFVQFSSPKLELTKKRVKGKHFKQKDFYIPILSILNEAKNPLTRKQIVEKIKDIFYQDFSKYDREIVGNKERWEKNARWAVTALKRMGLIKPIKRNNWIITERGKEFLKNFAEPK